MRDPRTERGTILIWAVLALVAVGAVMALAVNIGRMYSVRGGLQNGVDAGALAGAAELNGQVSGIDSGRQAAVAVAARHFTDSGLAVTIDAANDVVFGQWDRAARTFTRIDGRTAAELRIINAVRVTAGRETARGNAVPVIFGGAFLDRTTVDVQARAVAIGGGPCEDKCAFPATFADCLMVNPDGSLKCGQGFYVLSSDWQDNLGLTSLEPGVSASVPNIKAALDTCVDTRADTAIPVTNGNPLNPISGDPYFNKLPIEVSAPVVHADSCPAANVCTNLQSQGASTTCLNPKFVGDMSIMGFATFVICYVTGANPIHLDASGGLPGWPASCGPSPTFADFPGLDPAKWPNPFLKNSIFLQHKCPASLPGAQSGTGGCGFFGTSTTRSRLAE